MVGPRFSRKSANSFRSPKYLTFRAFQSVFERISRRMLYCFEVRSHRPVIIIGFDTAVQVGSGEKRWPDACRMKPDRERDAFRSSQKSTGTQSAITTTEDRKSVV